MKFFLSKKKEFFFYTVLFTLVVGCVYLPMYREGSTLVYGNGDAFHQHFPIFHHFITSLKTSPWNVFQFDWNIGLGSDMVSQFGYYITGDAFAYLGLLFPESKLELAYSFLIVVRLYACGFAFMIYCLWKKRKTYSSVLGAIIYTFSVYGFLAGVYHPYFLNAAILFPLFILATERLIDENKSGIFSVIVTITFVNNFYFAYKIVILAVVYAVIYYFQRYNCRMDKEYWQRFADCLKRAVISFGIGVLCSAVILFPVVYAYMTTSRVGSGGIPIDYDFEYYKTLLGGMVSSKNLYWSTIGTSAICLISIPASLVKFRKNMVLNIYGIVLMIILLVPLGGSVLNGFSYPTNRWSFAFVFVVAQMGVALFEEYREIKIKDIICILGFVMVYIIFVMKYYRNDEFMRQAIFYALVSCGIILLASVLKNRFCICVAGGIVILNVIALGVQIYETSGMKKQFLVYDHTYYRYETIDETMKGFEQAIKRVKNMEDGFYRIAMTRNNINNLSLLYDFNSLSEYLSLANGNLSNMSYQMENIDYAISKPIKQFDGRTQITNLIGTKYYFTDESWQQQVPYGYEKLFQEKNTVVYENKNTLPPLVKYETYADEDELENLNGNDIESNMFEMAFVNPKDIEQIEKNSVKKTEKNIPFEVLDSSELQIENNRIRVTDTTHKLIIKPDSFHNAELYLLLKGVKFDSATENSGYQIIIEKNDIKIKKSIEDQKSQYYVERPNYLINLGYENTFEDTIEITFTQPGVYSFDELELGIISMDSYEVRTSKLQEGIGDIQMTNNRISTKVTLKKNSIIQLSTGYTKGWTAYVDGKKADTFKCNMGFVGIEVSEGTHEVVFQYEIPYLKAGTITSLLGLAMLLLWTKIEKKGVFMHSSIIAECS